MFNSTNNNSTYLVYSGTIRQHNEGYELFEEDAENIYLAGGWYNRDFDDSLLYPGYEKTFNTEYNMYKVVKSED